MSPLTPFASDETTLRASDADRDRVAAVLGEALATGRLTSAEHADRLEAAYTAVLARPTRTRRPASRARPPRTPPRPATYDAGHRLFPYEVTAWTAFR